MDGKEHTVLSESAFIFKSNDGNLNVYGLF
jgi:hypothetical protein